MKLSLVPEDKFPTDRLASAAVASQDIKTVENMSEMAQFVYERYMAKMEELKGTLPSEEELEAMRNQLLQEDEESVPEASEEPPEKRAAKEEPLSKKKTTEAFKPTPILNEINVDDTEMGQREQIEEEATDQDKTQESAPAEES